MKDSCVGIRAVLARDGLTESETAVLAASGSCDRAVIWPRQSCEKVHKLGTAADGRTHFVAPTADALSLFVAGLIGGDGEITDEGRLVLAGNLADANHKEPSP